MIPPGASDSASFDNVLELLVLAGRPLAHAVMMMVPEAWEGRDDMPEALRGFYAYHEKLMEPWDGPGLDHVQRRPRSSARSSTATVCGPAAGRRPTTAGSCSRPRPARCRWSPSGWCSAGG